MPCRHPAHARGKNAADTALAVDFVNPMHRERPDEVALMPGDSDFDRLARRLRQGSPSACGFGKRNKPKGSRAACRCFETVGKARKRANEPGQVFCQEGGSDE